KAKRRKGKRGCAGHGSPFPLPSCDPFSPFSLCPLSPFPFILSPMSKRKQIEMSDTEVAQFLNERHTMSVATNGRDSYPHLVAMWYGFLDGKPAFWTYARSQKTRNLERDNRITCMIEDGDSYATLRGVM